MSVRIVSRPRWTLASKRLPHLSQLHRQRAPRLLKWSRCSGGASATDARKQAIAGNRGREVRRGRRFLEERHGEELNPGSSFPFVPAPIVWNFSAGTVGEWRIERVDAVVGDGLAPAERLAAVEGPRRTSPSMSWTLTGFTSNERYVERRERAALTAVQQPLGRPGATCAALIPIRKSEAWWELTQDERRSIPGGAVPPHRGRPGIPAGRREASAPFARSGRALRLPHLVRVHADRRGGVRGTGRPATRNGGVVIRRPGGRHSSDQIGTGVGVPAGAREPAYSQPLDRRYRSAGRAAGKRHPTAPYSPVRALHTGRSFSSPGCHRRASPSGINCVGGMSIAVPTGDRISPTEPGRRRAVIRPPRRRLPRRRRACRSSAIERRVTELLAELVQARVSTTALRRCEGHT